MYKHTFFVGCCMVLLDYTRSSWFCRHICFSRILTDGVRGIQVVQGFDETSVLSENRRVFLQILRKLKSDTVVYRICTVLRIIVFVK